MGRRGKRVALSATLAVLLAGPAAAQTVKPGGRVLVAPRAGWLTSVGSLGRVAERAAEGSTSAATRPGPWVSLGSGATIGTAALFDVPGLPVVWRVDVDLAPSLAVRLGEAPSPFEATATYATAGVVTRTGEGRVEPYGQAGIGLRALQFRGGAEGEASEGPLMPEGRVNLMARLGGGVAVRVGPLAVTAEMAALTSTFQFQSEGGAADRTFHVDLAGLLGLRLRVF